MSNEELILKSLLKKEPQHIRELSRTTKLHPNTVINFVDKLQRLDILDIVKSDKKYISFKRNLKSKNRKIMYIIEDIIDSGLISHLDDIFAIPTIILFGSASKGEMHENSDIDLCIISEIKKEINLKSFEEILNREIQIFIFTKDEFNKLSNELKNNIINGIIITGYLEVLE